MKKFTFLIILLLSACNNSEESKDSGESFRLTTSEKEPYLWLNDNFPKSLYISQEFSQTEINAIAAMGEQWKTSMENKKTFFNTSMMSSLDSEQTNIDNLFDDMLGIYKVYDWPEDLSPGSLGVTQIFGYRYNIGKPNEFVDIVHADILLNYDNFQFHSDLNTSKVGYDMRTVLIHEMGHFLGLKHIPQEEDRNSSVMYPYLRSSEIKRLPQERDITMLGLKYRIPAGDVTREDVMAEDEFEIEEDDPGKEVRIVLELMPDGNCVIREFE